MLKEKACKIIDEKKEYLFGISKEIHENPELGFIQILIKIISENMFNKSFCV